MSKITDRRTDEQKMGQDGTCATVVIKDKAGNKVRINAHEYDESKHGKALAHEDAAEVAPAVVVNGTTVKVPEQSGTDVDFTKMKKDQLKDHLADKGVAFDTDATKDELVALCVANP